MKITIQSVPVREQQSCAREQAVLPPAQRSLTVAALVKGLPAMKFICAVLFVMALSVALAQEPQPQRPHITGISHIALYVHDMNKTLAFYKDFLGFDQPFSLTNRDGTLHLTWIKINDRQSLELFPETTPNSDRLYHVALETDDAVGMYHYLAAHGVAVPSRVGKGRIGNLNYFIRDPDGHIVEIVQYMPDGWTMLNRGKSMPDTRISTNMPHVGILVGDVDAAKNFYEGILGFHEIWRGAKNPAVLSWIHERIPDGTDFIEFMLYSDLPPPDQRGKSHHFCLEVPDVARAKAILEARAPGIGYNKPMVIQIGVNRKRQLNLYDPDGTRVELMEPRTIDGKAAPPSNAPPPEHPLQGIGS